MGNYLQKPHRKCIRKPCKHCGGDFWARIEKSHEAKFCSRACQGLAQRGVKRGSLGPFSEEHKRKISEALKGRAKTDEHKRNMGRARRGKAPWNLGKSGYHIHSDEFKAKVAKQFSGKKLSEEQKMRISAGNKGRGGTSNRGRVPSIEERDRLSKTWKRKYLQGYQVPAKCGKGFRAAHTSWAGKEYCLRSSYEKKYAEWLDNRGVYWDYEVERFDLGEASYLPDFFIYNDDGTELERLVEIKGFITEIAAKKHSLFRELYPETALVVLTKSELNMHPGITI